MHDEVSPLGNVGGGRARARHLAARLRGAANLSILANASSLVGTTAVTSIFGFAYWWIAARLFAPQAVGFASASVAAMLLLGTVGALGFGTLLIGELPRRRGHEASFIVAALLATGAAGALLGAGFALCAPLLSTEFQPWARNIGTVALFATGVGYTSATMVLDQALIGLLRGGTQFWRNAIFAWGKLLALVAVALGWDDRRAMAIFATWVVGNLLSLLWVATRISLWRGRNWRTYLPRWGLVWASRRAALGHHVLNLALQGTSYLLPVVVTALLSATTNAYFYAAWTMAGFAFAGPMALAVALYAVGAHDAGALAQRMRFTLGLACLGGLAANAVLLVGADLLLHLFGATYAENASATLRIIGLGVFPIIIKDHYVTIRRIGGDLRGAAILVAVGGVLELAFAAGGAAIGGITGLAVGLLIGLCLEAALMAPAVYRAARPALESGAIRAAPGVARREPQSTGE